MALFKDLKFILIIVSTLITAGAVYLSFFSLSKEHRQPIDYAQIQSEYLEQLKLSKETKIITLEKLQTNIATKNNRMAQLEATIALEVPILTDESALKSVHPLIYDTLIDTVAMMNQEELTAVSHKIILAAKIRETANNYLAEKHIPVLMSQLPPVKKAADDGHGAPAEAGGEEKKAEGETAHAQGNASAGNLSVSEADVVKSVLFSTYSVQIQ